MTDFWAKQRAKVAAENPPPAPASDVPWWAQGTNLVPKQAQPQNVVPDPTEGRTHGSVIDGHDISRADFLKGKAEECPNCPVNPSSGIRGNMYKATSSSAWRCFDCGYVDGREIHSDVPLNAVAEGPARAAKQIAGGGFHANPYDQSGRSQAGVDS